MRQRDGLTRRRAARALALGYDCSLTHALFVMKSKGTTPASKLAACLLCIATCAPSLSGCAADTTCSETPQTRTQPIKVADGELVATNVIAPVLLAILLDDPEGPVPICTGTRIQPGVALTAYHCVRDVELGQLLVRSAANQARSAEARTASDGCAPAPMPVESASVLDFVRHDELDLALVSFEETLDHPSATLADEPIAADSSATIAGFGTTESYERGALRAIDVDVLSVDADWITVQARGGGACTGDSGGPLYTSDDGQLTLHGVLSRGSASCYGKDQYVPLTSAKAWLESLDHP